MVRHPRYFVGTQTAPCGHVSEHGVSDRLVQEVNQFVRVQNKDLAASPLQTFWKWLKSDDKTA